MSKGSTTRKISSAVAKGYMAFLARYDASIVLLTGAAAGSEFTLQSDRIIMGRGPDVDLALDNSHLSRQHAAFELTANGFQVRDLGSTNGVTVNGEKVDVAPLEHGDRIGLGELTLQYVIEERTGATEFEVSDG